MLGSHARDAETSTDVRHTTAANLGAVIEQLSQRKGIRFVTLTELFRS